MEKPTEIRIEQQDGICLLNIHGDLTSYSEPYLNEAYSQFEKEDTGSDLILIFDKEAYINSGGIAALIQVLAKISTSDRKIGITGISDHFAKIFKMVGIAKLARIFGSLDEALATIG